MREAFSKRVALLLLSICVSCRVQRERSVTIATTTSLESSGLLQVIRTEFERETGIALHAFVIGSGQALRMASKGEVDLTITHDPETERAFVSRTKPEVYRQFMWNEFVIVGPPEDPAGAGRATSAAEAFRRIHDTASRFASRNDESGTHMRELALWRVARVSPTSNPAYVSMGQTMAQLLRSADEMRAYTLTDRATFDQLAAGLRLRILLSGDPALRNTYAIILMRRPASEQHDNARELARWLVSPAARHVVETLRINGRQEFHWIEQ
jgi:tungstate transport system substrate-binding protein